MHSYQESSNPPEVVATDSKNLNGDKTHPETTPAEPQCEETKQDEKSPAAKVSHSLLHIVSLSHCVSSIAVREQRVESRPFSPMKKR